MRRRPHLVVLGVAAAALTCWVEPPLASAATNWIVRLAATSSGQGKAQALPTAPSGVTATCNAPTTSTVIKVTWSAVTHATNYAVYQATSATTTPGAYTKITTVATTSWTSGTLTAGTHYWYEVATTIGTNWTSTLSTATTMRTINSANPFCA